MQKLPWITSSFTRIFSKRGPKLVAATVALAGAAAGTYYVTSVDSTPTGALILTPADNSTWTTDADGCSNGFTTDVTVQTNAADGTEATLMADGLRVAETTVASGRAVFPDVMLGTKDRHLLVAKILGARSMSAINVECGVQCKMLGPTWSPDVPGLNGKPRAIDAGANTPDDTWTSWGGGDRVSSKGSPYQFRINGTTTVPVGAAIEVHVDGSMVGQTVRPTGGQWFSIHGVPVGSDDGDHSVYLRCVDGADIGFSTASLVNVDTKPPQLTVLTPGDSTSRSTGSTLRVCASTTSADALGLDDQLGDAKRNICAAVGTSTPVCAAGAVGEAAGFWTDVGGSAPASTSMCGGELTCPCPSDPAMTCTDSTQTPDGACFDVTCPGPGIFDLRVSIYDEVRNVTTKTVQAVRCPDAPGPTVQIVDPVGGSPLEISSDIAKRVLASTTLAAPRRDQDPAAEGAQYAVVACTDANVGDAASLVAGRLGYDLTQVATASVQSSEGACPFNEARFTGATLPETYEDSLGRLSAPTRIRVDIGQGSSPPVDLWVDTTLPEIALESPFNCGDTLPDAGTYTVRVRSNALPVTLTVTNSNGTQKFIGLEYEPEL